MNLDVSEVIEKPQEKISNNFSYDDKFRPDSNYSVHVMLQL